MDNNKQNLAESTNRQYTIAILFIMTVGILLRTWFVAKSDFPLNDGGLFIAMIRDIQQANFHLPAYTSYNNALIPFAYPPLAFYITGFINKAFGINLMILMQYIPLLFSILSIFSYYYLIKNIHQSRTAIITSLLVFVTLPDGFLWRIMGGGLSRSPGFFFAILALLQAFLLFKQRRLKYCFGLVLASSATLLCHPETAFFLATSIVIMLWFVGRHKVGFLGVSLATGAILVITVPWWAMVISYHGIGVFLNAQHLTDNAIIGLLTLVINPTNEVMVAVCAFLALLGILFELKTRHYWLPVWALIIYLLHNRWPQQEAVIPISILAGYGAVSVLIPLIRKDTPDNTYFSERIRPVPNQLGLLQTSVVGLIIGLSISTSVMYSSAGLLVPLPLEERNAMDWIFENTPKESKFLILSSTSWWDIDRTSEWFPLLADRESIITDQGYEWLGTYPLRAKIKRLAQLCVTQGTACLDRLKDQYELDFTHVYIAKNISNSSDEIDEAWSIRNALSHDESYTLIYDGPGATLFRRNY